MIVFSEKVRFVKRDQHFGTDEVILYCLQEKSFQQIIEVNTILQK